MEKIVYNHFSQIIPNSSHNLEIKPSLFSTGRQKPASRFHPYQQSNTPKIPIGTKVNVPVI